MNEPQVGCEMMAYIVVIPVPSLAGSVHTVLWIDQVQTTCDLTGYANHHGHV